MPKDRRTVETVDADPGRATVLVNYLISAMRKDFSDYHDADLLFGLSMALAITARQSDVMERDVFMMLRKCMSAPLFKMPAGVKPS